jgi:Rieske Fe-S protein
MKAPKASPRRPAVNMAASTDGGMGTGRMAMTTPASFAAPAASRAASAPSVRGMPAKVKPAVKKSTAPRPFVPKR